MKTFSITAGTGIDALALAEVPTPGPLTAGQIRVSMRAAALNYRDLLVVSGQLGPIPPQGLVMCSDGAGEVIEVADDVRRVKVGDRVTLTFLPDWMGGPFRDEIVPMSRGYPLPGVMAEQCVVDHSEAVVLPPHLSFEEAATLPCAGLTAWYALCGDGPCMPGMTVLVQGGGGVSVFALQFAKLFGARVIATSSSDERCQRLQQLGADDTINYRQNPDWQQTVRELTGGRGADITIEVGGAGTIDRSLAATSRAGRLALVGLLSGWPNEVSTLFTSGVAINPIRVGSRDDFNQMNRAITYHQLQPVIDRVFAFDALPEAMRHLESGQQFGKIVVQF